MAKQPCALVVGASTSIGAEYARQLAARGYGLALVARRRSLLNQLAEEIRASSDVEVQTLSMDLAEPGAVERLVEWTQTMEIDFLVCNVTLHRVGLFEALDLDTKIRMVRMNAELPVRLVHAFGPAMVDRQRGSILLINALNCLAPLDIDAVFQGTKSFLLVFGESLWQEYRRHGVGVGVAMLSGIEGSESYENKLSAAKRRIVQWAGLSMSPKRIVAQTLEQLDRGDCILIPDTALLVNKSGYQMGLAVRFARSPRLTRTFSAFYRWLLDGDEGQSARPAAKVTHDTVDRDPGRRTLSDCSSSMNALRHRSHLHE